MLPRESRGFHMAFQLALLEARDAVEAAVKDAAPSLAGGGDADPHRPAELRRRRAADAVCAVSGRRRRRCATTWPRWRRVSACRSSRRATGCPRLQRPGARGVPFFFVRVDPAGNVSKRFSAAGFPFARFGGSCPRWVVHTAFAQPGACRCRSRNCPTARRSCASRAPCGVRPRAGASRRRSMWWRWAARSPTPPMSSMPTGWIWSARRCGIGLSCRLCDRPDCRSRAFPPLEHRLALDPNSTGVSPYRFER